MKIKIDKAWINARCDECGELVYPKRIYKVQPEEGKKTNYAWWRFCEKCFKEIFREEVKK